jgi:transposase
MLLQVLFSIRSERQLMEQTQYNMLFRWFIGLSMDDAVWVPTVFTKNRQRLIEHDAVAAFFNEVINTARTPGCSARVRPPASCATWARRSPTTATAWS